MSGGDFDFAARLFFFFWTIGSIFVVYFAMKLVSMVREARETAKLKYEQQQKSEERKKGASA